MTGLFSTALLALMLSSAVLALPTGNSAVTARPVQLVLGSTVQGLDDCFSSEECPSLMQGDYSCCSEVTKITDGDKSSKVFSTTENSVFIFPNEEQLALFTFETSKDINKIRIHYYGNTNDKGFPKIRFNAVPDDFQITDTVQMSYPSKVLDEVLPGDGPQGLTNKTMEVSFNTKQLLMEKEESKTFQLYVSEIEFFTQESTVAIATTTSAAPEASTESSEEKETTQPSGTTARTTSKDQDYSEDEVEVTGTFPSINGIGGLTGGAAAMKQSISCTLALLLAGLLAVAIL